MNRKIPNRFKSRSEPLFRPSHSPDLSLFDRFLFGYLKDIVYRNRASNLEELESNTKDVAFFFGSSTWEKMHNNLGSRFFFIVREDRGRFEYLQNSINPLSKLCLVA